MLVSMHQPDYLPWCGYFNKIVTADAFIFFDTAHFSKEGFHERNKIKTATGWAYLTIPMPHESAFKPLKDAKLPIDTRWANKHWRALISSYNRTPYFKEHAPYFEDLYANVGRFTTLADLNIDIITYLCQAFGIKTMFSRASDYPFDSGLKSTEAILAIIKQAGATEFLAGPSGKKYLNQPRFPEEGIKLIFQEYHEPEHTQRKQPFVAAVDLLFNEGPQAINFLR